MLSDFSWPSNPRWRRALPPVSNNKLTEECTSCVSVPFTVKWNSLILIAFYTRHSKGVLTRDAIPRLLLLSQRWYVIQNTISNKFFHRRWHGLYECYCWGFVKNVTSVLVPSVLYKSLLPPPMSQTVPWKGNLAEYYIDLYWKNIIWSFWIRNTKYGLLLGTKDTLSRHDLNIFMRHVNAICTLVINVFV